MRWMVPMALILVLLSGACRGNSESENLVDDITIQVQTEPNPPAVGEATLLIRVTDAEGQPVDGATVAVHGDMDHAGMVPVDSVATGSANGDYRAPFSWTMGGGWLLEITVTLPDDRGIAKDTVEFFVDAIPVESIIHATGASRELRITIPEGTTEMLRAGEDPGLVNGDITLKLSEQNVLIIENHDSFPHMVGPFFIGVGESVRQTFTRPAVYEGGCSIHEDEQIRIVVEN